jgi:mycotoxin biosynthesis protein UstYa
MLLVLLISAVVMSFSAESSCSVKNSQLTDLTAARGAITYEEQMYTGDLAWDDASKTITRLHDAPVEYFGAPSQTLDDAWASLLRNEFAPLRENELPQSIRESDKADNGQYWFELDVYHNLHCLNAVRKGISRSLYPSPASDVEKRDEGNATDIHGPEWDHIHLEHCMDRIRQALMCQADMTPSIMHRWGEPRAQLYKTEKRLCRKWEPIRQYMDERVNGPKRDGDAGGSEFKENGGKVG